MKAPAASTAFSLAIALLSSVVSIGIGAMMLTAHLPFQIDERSTRNLAQTLRLPQHTWVEVDLLGAGCGCSRGVAQHLLSRGLLPALQEQVVIAGSDREISSWFAGRHWATRTLPADQAASVFGTHGAPFLILVDPQGNVRYAGGYSPDRNPRGDYRDQVIWKEVQQGKTVTPYPVFGCVIERRIQKRIDPLDLKYGFLAGRS